MPVTLLIGLLTNGRILYLRINSILFIGATASESASQLSSDFSSHFTADFCSAAE